MVSHPRRITHALLSVSDKSGLTGFAKALAGYGVELVSTGGTAKALKEAGLDVRDVSELTGFPEMMDGRVKTLHPKVHGGLLAVRDDPEHAAAMAAHGIGAIDLVVVNLYPFLKTVMKGAERPEIIENIDIGGPSMVRSAAKNFRDVAIVTSTDDYANIAQEMAASGGELGLATRWRLAQKAFATTAAYDSAIAATLASTSLNDATQFQLPAAGGGDFPAVLRFSLNKAMDLRYGENPHQRAAMYSDGSAAGVANGKQLQRKELSYAGDHLRRQQRVATQLEEVVLDPHSFHFQYVAPDARQNLLFLRPRRREFRFQLWPLLPRQRQRLAVDFTARRQRQLLQKHEGVGHHVFRQHSLQVLA